MDAGTLALLIPLAGIGLGGFGIWVSHQQKMAKIQSEVSAEKAAQYAANTERLEQRIAVLERIITDGRADLAQQIEDLRDKPLN